MGKMDKWLRTGVAATMLAGGAMAQTKKVPEINFPQKQEQIKKGTEQKSGTREKYNKMMDVADEVKKFDTIEQQEYKNYLQASKGSNEEKNLFRKLTYNHLDLENQMMKLMEYSADEDSVIADKAMSIWVAQDKSVQARRKECSTSGKDYFDRVPAPNNPRPPKD